jgi:hypothetical protein
MTTQKDFKRLVRARMHKTGESYTSARAVLLKKRSPSLDDPGASPRGKPHPVPDYATLAGITDEAIKAKTGCTWERWVKALDYHKAYAWPHREIAEYVHEKYKVPDWWSQTVTVGYERIKGLRAIGQRMDGSYEASKSKVFAVPLGRLFRAWAVKRTRSRWLPGVDLTVRTATKDRSMRISWPDNTTVDVWFMGKGPAKAQVQLAHKRLTDRPSVDRMKAFWTERLGALGEVLAP